MNLKEVKTLIVGTIKQSFTNKKTLDKFDGASGTLKYNGVPVNNVPVFVADDSPVGNIIAFMGNAAPQDYLICDGTEYNIADYPLLAQHILVEFGTYNYFGGDGETTFAVPDLRGEFLRGTGTNSHENQGNGAEVGEHQDASARTRIVTDANGKLVIDYLGQSYATTIANADSSYQVGTESDWQRRYNASISDAGKTTLFTSRPTNTSVLYCIKYQITQNNISKDMVNYSLEEQVIGSWIDGKPLYQKTVEFGNLPNATTKEVKHNIENADNIWICEGYIFNPSGNMLQLNSTHCIDVTGQISFHTTVQHIVCNTGKYDRSTYTATVTLRYTKTTDAENSFTPEMLSNISSFNTTVTDEDVNDVIGGI